MSRVRLAKSVLFGAALAAAISAALAWATPGSGFSSTLLARSTTDARIKIQTRPHELSDILVQQVTIQPGGYSGWHSHPGPGMVAVKAGVAAVYHADDPSCTPRYVPAGSAFTEDANDVHFVRNEGSVAYEAVATFVLPMGVPVRTDEPNPGNCPF